MLSSKAVNWFLTGNRFSEDKDYQIVACRFDTTQAALVQSVTITSAQ